MTLQELKENISKIANETQPGANTAKRIGSTMQDIASFVPGYPVVTIKDNFTINAEPNTFYNIKNSDGDSVDISIDSDKYSVDDNEQEKLTMFTWDTWREDIEECTSNNGIPEISRMIYPFVMLNHYIKEDNTYEDYKYSSFQSFETQFTDEDSDSGQIVTEILTYQMKSYFSDEVKTGNDVDWYIKQILMKRKSVDENGVVLEEEELDIFELMEQMGEQIQDIIIPITNIQVLTDNSDDLVLITLKEDGESVSSDVPSDIPHVFVEVENDNSEYSYKYEIFGLITLEYFGIQYIYTNEPLPNTTDIYAIVEHEGDVEGEVEVVVGNLSEVADIKFIKNIPIKGCEVANEYIFNINSPANVTFNQSVKWNNGNEPDLSQSGTYTISLLNGVGCFTFVE